MNAKSKLMAAVLGCTLAILGLLPIAANAAEPDVVRLGWYGGPRIWVIGKANGLFEKAMGSKVEWVQFPSGAGALTGLASKQVDIARMGSSATVAGISRGLPIEVISVSGVIKTSERLIAKAPIQSVADLKGKTIAYPPGSTAQYALMAALKVSNVPVGQVKLLSLAPSEMVAAWKRGDIDAAYVWSPFTDSMLVDGGKQIMATGDLQKEGYYVFNTFVVRKEFAEKYPQKVVQFLKAFEQSIDMYNKDTVGMVKLIATHLSQKEDGVRVALEGLYSPMFEEQLAAGKYLGNDGVIAPAMLDTAKFLVTLGELRASELPADFRSTINTTYMKRAINK
jgi:taurine transport system substrate-binding protein